MRSYRKVDEHFELRIDGGRLALLGVGAGLVLLLVFLLGVLVGKGLWGGRRPAPLPPAEALQPAPESASKPRPEYTFYDDLKRPEPPPPAPERPAEPPAPSAGATSIPAARPKPETKPETKPKAEAPRRAAEPPAPASAAPKPPPAAAPKPPLPTPVFTVQVGSFRDRAAAQDLSRRVSAQGVSVQVVQASVAGRTWYRVQVGRFETRAQAEAHYRNHLRPRGIQGFVTTR